MSSIIAIKAQAGEGPATGVVSAQVKTHETKRTKGGGKPFLSIVLVDATGEFTLRVWNDHAQFHECSDLKVGDCIEISGEFKTSDWGLEAAKWTFKFLIAEEKELLLRGSPELIAKQAEDWLAIYNLVEGMTAGQPLTMVCRLFLMRFEAQFRRAAAARGNHHARRGGLVEHVSMMMQSASALCEVYRDMNRDLVLAAILFHDCGKMWENQYEESGFVMPFSVFSECYGHIVIGVQILHKLWSEVTDLAREHPGWESRNDLRDLLSHLILSHHGELPFGSPVTPKLPEGYLVHFVDNLDAKVEMMNNAYAEGKVVAPGVVEAKWPMKGYLLLRPAVPALAAPSAEPVPESAP